MGLDNFEHFDQFSEELAAYIHGSQDALVSRLNQSGLSDLSRIVFTSEVDHVGIRVGWGGRGEGDYSRYQQVRKHLIEIGMGHFETIIPPTEEGRPITIVELNKPIADSGVCHLEVPAPRFGKAEQEGVDHVEMVLPNQYSLGVLLENYGVTMVERGILTLDRYDKAYSDQINGKWNADLVIEIDDFKIKLHEQHIKEVVEYEKANFDLDMLHKAFRMQYPGVMIEG